MKERNYFPFFYKIHQQTYWKNWLHLPVIGSGQKTYRIILVGRSVRALMATSSTLTIIAVPPSTIVIT